MAALGQGVSLAGPGLAFRIPWFCKIGPFLTGRSRYFGLGSRAAITEWTNGLGLGGRSRIFGMGPEGGKIGGLGPWVWKTKVPGERKIGHKSLFLGPISSHPGNSRSSTSWGEFLHPGKTSKFFWNRRGGKLY